MRQRDKAERLLTLNVVSAFFFWLTAGCCVLVRYRCVKVKDLTYLDNDSWFVDCVKIGD
jgi:hypothetical protein